MEVKGSKQLYHKLFFIYTMILVCAISALVIFFLNSTRSRFLEQSLSYTEMMNDARELSTKRMIEEAQKLGADAIVNVRYASSAIMQGAAEVIAYGTAVKFVN